MVDNVGVGVGISTISHSRPEIQVLPVSKPPFCFYGYKATAGDVATSSIVSGVLENIGLAVEIVQIGHF